MHSTLHKIGVVRGGIGPTYNHSLASGAHMLKKLPTMWQPVDIFIDQSGVWHLGGLPILPERALGQVDAVVNALHSDEARMLAQLLRTHHIPFTASGELASALSLHRNFARDISLKNGFRIPNGIVVSKIEGIPAILQKVFSTLSGALIIKPLKSGLRAHIRKVRGHFELAPALEELFGLYPELLVEESMQGQELTLLIIENFRGEREYASIPFVVSDGNLLKTFAVPEIKQTVISLARKLHAIFGARHYSQMDVIVHKSGALYVIDFNTHPYLGEDGLFMNILAQSGARPEEFIKTIVLGA